MNRSSASSEPLRGRDLVIRPAREEDLPDLVALIHELAAYERLEEECDPDPEDLRETLFGRRPVAEALICEWQGATAGMAVFFHGMSTFRGLPTLYLEDLFVRPAFRRRGIGREVLAHLARLARQRGCCRFEWSVLDWNVPAQEFYRSLGASPLEEWTTWRVEGDDLDRLATDM